jgi:hypothetical protein
MKKGDKLDFNTGTINFWVPEGRIDYMDNKFVQLFYYKDDEGTIKVVKDKDNGLKVYYLYDGNKCFLNTSVEYLEDHDKHMVTITWSLSEKKVKLYIDAELKDECDIETSPF